MKKILINSIRHVVLLIICLIMVFPLLWMVLGSVKTSQEAMNPEIPIRTREGSLHLRILKNSPMMKARSAQSISKWIRVLMLKLLKSA